MEQLKVSIKPKFEPVNGQMLNSSGYSVKINDWKLGRGVTDFTLEMPAGKKPKATITFNPDIVDIEVTAASIQTLSMKMMSVRMRFVTFAVVNP